MNKRVLTGVLAALLLAAGFVRAGAASYHEGDVEEYVLQQLSAANIPGVSLSIVTSQKEIYSVAFGDVKETSSDMQICSLTRTFTTLAVMQLAEKGKINLDDKVIKYLSNPPQNIAYSTTVQDLLSYTRPYKHELELADTLEIYNPDTEGGVLSLNTKFNLLGEIVEAVSGMDYAAYIKKNILTPLDMQSTYTAGQPGSTSNITQGSRNYFGLPLKDNIDYNEGTYWLGVPSNGIVSDVKDMAKYMQMYLSAGGKVVSYNTVKSIINNKGGYMGKSIFGTNAYYSMGWTSTEVYGEEVYYCNGSVENYTSAMFIIPSMDVGVVILFNSADALTGQKYTDKIAAGAVSLVMGKTAMSISSNSYLMEHGVADVIYFLAFVFSIMPLLMMEVWVRWTKDKFSIIRLSADVLIHIALPTALVFAISRYIAPWKIIMKVLPDMFFVAVVVIGLFYLGLVVKIIAYFVIMLKKRKEKNEEETEENKGQDGNNYITQDINGEKEAKENKDIMLKRMKDMKEAEKSETENKKTEQKTDIKKEEEILTEKPAEKMPPDRQEIEEDTKQKNTGQELEKQNVTHTNRKMEKEPENKNLKKENTASKTNTNRAKNKGKQQNNLKNRQEQARTYNKPKRFVVVNDAPASKSTKGKSNLDNKKNSNNNRNQSKNNQSKNNQSKNNQSNKNQSNKNRNNKNTNSSTNRKKSSYNNTGSRNKSAKN